jgi:GAF domain-containing protein
MTLKHNPASATRLEDIIITSQLSERPDRHIDLEKENIAFCELAQQFARDPNSFPQALTELALKLCDADTVGINIKQVDEGATIFRWIAVAGELKHLVGEKTPDDFSPCEICLTTKKPLLIVDLDRFYPQFRETNLRFVETLLVPWDIGGGTSGTLWVVAHRERRKFDQEDVRLMGSFAAFAAGARCLKDLLLQSQRSVAAANIAASMAHHINNPLQGALLALHQAKAKTESGETRELILVAELLLGRVKKLSAELIREGASGAPR